MNRYLRSGWHCVVALAAVWLTCSNAYAEGPFETTGFSRSVSLSANLEVEESATGTVNDLQLREAWRDLNAEQVARSVFISHDLQDSVIRVDGQAKADVDLTSAGIRFEGLADVLVSGAESFSHSLTGFGTSSAELSWSFQLAQELTALLSMRSDEQPDGSYEFRLIYLGHSGSDKKSLIWSDTVVYDYWGNPLYEFTRPINLKPGYYQLIARLNTSSHLNSGGRVAASFHLRPSPVEQNYCCMALTAACLSCAAGLPVVDYCALYPKTQGCDETGLGVKPSAF